MEVLGKVYILVYGVILLTSTRKPSFYQSIVKYAYIAVVIALLVFFVFYAAFPEVHKFIHFKGVTVAFIAFLPWLWICFLISIKAKKIREQE